MENCKIQLSRSLFADKEREFLRVGDFRVSVFRFDTGVEAVRLSNSRGELVVLPFLGQIIWDATFDGVRLTMDSMFRAPRPVTSIVETYGCLNYHAGILRNGSPQEGDDHALHGELPCAPMDSAWLELGVDSAGSFVRIVGEFEYARGFGAHYVAHPSVRLVENCTEFEIGLTARNLASIPMDVMYLCHLNFAFCEGARIHQPAPFTSGRTSVRTTVPPHVPKTPAFVSLIDQLARDPSAMQTLDPVERFDPEQVFYIRKPDKCDDGLVHYLLQRKQGDGFSVAFDPDVFSHTIRWLMANGDQRVAGFALPATCEPEGYSAEKRKGNVRSLGPGQTVDFRVRAGYVDRDEAAKLARRISNAQVI